MGKPVKQRILTELDAKQFLKKYGIPVTRQFLAKNKDQAVAFAKKLKFPVVMKIASPDIIHKTEAKGVIINVCNEQEAEKNFDLIIKNARAYNKKAKIQGVLIQEQAHGIETIIGTSKDAQFGQTIMFGLGGIFVEVLKDVSFRIIPIKKDDALEMVQEIKNFQVLKGVRGKKPVNINAIVSVLLKVSALVAKNKQIRELDINPLFVDEKGAVCADARVIFEQ